MWGRTCSSSTRTSALTAACASRSARWRPSCPTATPARARGWRSTGRILRSGRTSRPRTRACPCRTRRRCAGRRTSSSGSSPRSPGRGISAFMIKEALDHISPFGFFVLLFMAPIWSLALFGFAKELYRDILNIKNGKDVCASNWGTGTKKTITWSSAPWHVIYFIFFKFLFLGFWIAAPYFIIL
jgi:hypothetical protein